MTHRMVGVVAILLAVFPGVAGAQPNCAAIPRGPERTDCYLASVNTIVANRIWPLPKRARNQTPPGIGRSPEPTLRSANPIGDDERSLIPSQQAARHAGIAIVGAGFLRVFD